MATQYGKTWWGQQWLNSLTNIDYSNRLPRGATYARNGSVTKIKIDGNRITAKVKGSRPSPYNVDIIAPPFFDPELGVFLERLSQRPAIISKLLNRELDPQLLTLAEECGLKVFPKQWSDLKMQCSCPDWAVPCKHLAAVVYKVCSEIDNNPFLVFQLHNVDLLAHMAKAGLVIKHDHAEIPAINSLLFDKNADMPVFDPEQAYRKLNMAALVPLHEPLTALLAPSPAFYTVSASDFRDKYLATLTRVVKNTKRAASGKTPLPEFFSGAYADETLITRHSDHAITIDESFAAKVRFDDKELSVRDFLQQLSQIQAARTADYQPSTAALHSALHLALQLTANGAVVPQIVALPNKSYAVRWLPALLSKEVRRLCGELESMLPPQAMTAIDRKKAKPVSRDRAVNLLSLFITEILHLVSHDLNADLFLELFFKNKGYAFNQPGEEALAGGIQTWLQRFYLTQGAFQPVLAVEELPRERFGISVLIRQSRELMDDTVPLKDVLTQPQYLSSRFEILQSLSHLSCFVDGLDEYINANAAEPIVMDTACFAPFLMKMVPAIELLDVSVLLPKSLQQVLRPKASVKLKSKGKSSGLLRLDKLLDFEWQVALGDTLMDEAEFHQLMKQSEGLIRFKTNFIYVDPNELEKLYKHFAQSRQMSAFQLMRTALSGEYQGAPVAMDDEVKRLIRELSDIDQVPLPKGLNAILRPYQQRGFSWMYRNTRVGFGSVLADDMGLGKTLQVIATLLKYKEEGLLDTEKALVVAPTGLLTNWQAEIQKFAPALRASIYHGTNRDLNDAARDCDVLITSYGILRGDADLLKKHKWHTLVIDEAQNIKNTTTAQTKAVKSIKAENFVALSGTPVENRLSELWSIMDYSNRGFLGTPKEFADTFGNPIEQLNDAKAAEQLKMVTSPFLMRRLKSDKSIISDLPDKIEMDCFASLTKEQTSLYEKTLEKAMLEIQGITQTDQKSLFVRQGLVLQMIMALKQICNHPTQFLKNGLVNPDLSGKTGLLFDKLDSIMESGEKVLIFSQFTEMADLLQRFIEARYGEKPLYYHGGCSLAQRTDMVTRFQTNHADKVFLLSLKAAGTGLNLTAANHVIHYDLWWNPAVEAQATDRAYRIGQKNNVMVHRFITKNTFEERINEMIQQKKNLAEMTVATGENWIGNLSDKELRSIFDLG